MKQGKLTSLERNWILYDVGNSAFILLVSTILPIYFDQLAGDAGLSSVNYLAYWGYAVSLSTLLVAFSGPILGALADTRGFKKPIFLVSMLVGVLGCAAFGIPMGWLPFLALFVVTKVGYSFSLIFYDSMLTDVTERGCMDRVSSQGYAWGYIGSCLPFSISLLLVLGHEAAGLSMTVAMGLAFLINAAWWLFMSVPLLRSYRQIHYVEGGRGAVCSSLRRLRETLSEVKSQKRIFLFLLAFFFYIDGVYTIIEMATAYGSSLGLGTAGLLLALLMTQIVAFPSALIFGQLAKKYAAGKLILVCILAYVGIALFGIQLDQQWEFWVLALFVGMFQGGIQALSRSYFARLIPPEKSGEYFGLFDICGKGASFAGTFMVGLTAQITGKPSAGIGILAVMFVIGFALFWMADGEGRQKEKI